MTKYLFIFIFAIYGCQENSSVKSLIEIRTEIAKFKNESDSLNANFILKSIEKFNDKEHLISKVEYYDNGKPEQEYNYEYNENGLLSKITMTDHYGKGSLNTETFKYNSSDSLIYKKTSENTFSMRDSFIRDSGNRLIMQKTFIKTDTLIQFKEFTYDLDDNLSIEKRFNKDKLLLDSIGYRFNDSGLMTKEYVYNRNEFDIYDYQNEHTYDSFGNNIKSKMYIDSDSSYTIFEREFYKNGKLRLLKTKGIGYTRFNSTIQVFDSLGNMISNRIIGDGGSAEKNWSMKFGYDSEGNWISKKSYYQNKLRSITKRTLTYK